MPSSDLLLGFPLKSGRRLPVTHRVRTVWGDTPPENDNYELVEFLCPVSLSRWHSWLVSAYPSLMGNYTEWAVPTGATNGIAVPNQPLQFTTLWTGAYHPAENPYGGWHVYWNRSLNLADRIALLQIDAQPGRPSDLIPGLRIPLHQFVPLEITVTNQSFGANSSYFQALVYWSKHSDGRIGLMQSSGTLLISSISESLYHTRGAMYPATPTAYALRIPLMDPVNDLGAIYAKDRKTDATGLSYFAGSAIKQYPLAAPLDHEPIDNNEQYGFLIVAPMFGLSPQSGVYQSQTYYHYPRDAKGVIRVLCQRK